MAKKSPDRIAAKRTAWVERTARLLGVSQETTQKLLSVERKQSLRVNTLKAPVDQTVAQLKDLGWSGSQFEWSNTGLRVDIGLDAVKDSDLVTTGQVYIQNAASWIPVQVLDPKPADSILDICAAPGGKTSHIAALTNNQAHITANDNSRPRLAKLQANLRRLGVTNVEYTLFDAMQLSKKLDGKLYDKILLDAPCSGEGMMQFQHDIDFASWSVAHIKRLQQLQKRLIVQAWQVLKPGGVLVYSTCTMAPEENEAVVDYLLRHNSNAELGYIELDVPNRVNPVLSWNDKQYNQSLKLAARLIPSEDIEAFFVCKIHKLDS